MKDLDFATDDPACVWEPWEQSYKTRVRALGGEDARTGTSIPTTAQMREMNTACTKWLQKRGLPVGREYMQFGIQNIAKKQ